MAIETRPTNEEAYRRWLEQQRSNLYENQLAPPASLPRLNKPPQTSGTGVGAQAFRNLFGQGGSPFAPEGQVESAPNMMGPTNDRAEYTRRQLAAKEAAQADTAMLNSARAVGSGVRGSGVPGGDPYSEFLQGYYDDLAGSYDAQIAAIAGLGPLFKQQAQEAQGNIGDFFGYAGNVAREGIPVTQEVYGTAEGNVNQVYDQLGERLQSMPQQLTDVASEAAGSAVGGSVAGRVAAATAPFAAAGETARANAVSNLTQSSAAGQNYLNQLASSTGAEAGMHQSAVEQALNQQLQHVAFRQAEIEGAKQRALMEISSDIAGESSERMANAALANALGISGAPEGVDPLDFLRAQGMMQDLQGGQLSQQQAALNLTREMNPDWQVDQVMSGLTPASQNQFNLIQRQAESQVESTDPRDLGYQMLQVLDQMANEAAGIDPEGGSIGKRGYKGLGPKSESVGNPRIRAELEQAIRALYTGT